MSVSMIDNAVDAFVARVGASSKPFSIKTPDGKMRTVGTANLSSTRPCAMTAR